MGTGEASYLAGVIIVFLVFASVLAWVSSQK